VRCSRGEWAREVIPRLCEIAIFWRATLTSADKHTHEMHTPKFAKMLSLLSFYLHAHKQIKTSKKRLLIFVSHDSAWKSFWVFSRVAAHCTLIHATPPCAGINWSLASRHILCFYVFLARKFMHACIQPAGFSLLTHPGKLIPPGKRVYYYARPTNFSANYFVSER